MQRSAKKSHAPMRLALIVHCAPSAPPAESACQVAAAAQACGHDVTIFFHGDGCWHAQPAAEQDYGERSLHERYRDLASGHKAAGAVRLLVCRASCARRMPALPEAPWQAAGLIEMAEMLPRVDRVISFAGA